MQADKPEVAADIAGVGIGGFCGHAEYRCRAPRGNGMLMQALDVLDNRFNDDLKCFYFSRPSSGTESAAHLVILIC